MSNGSNKHCKENESTCSITLLSKVMPITDNVGKCYVCYSQAGHR